MVIMLCVNDDRFGLSGIVIFNVVLFGIMLVNELERGFYFLIDFIYNIEGIIRLVMYKYIDEIINMLVFMVIGLYNEMLCGNNLGNKYFLRNMVFNVFSVL